MTARPQIKLRNQLSLPQPDDCKTSKGDKVLHYKTGIKHIPSQRTGALINNESPLTKSLANKEARAAATEVNILNAGNLS